MPHLQLQRSVTERAAPLYAFAAADAKLFIYRVFEKRFLDEFPFEGIRGAKLVLGTRVQGLCPGLEIPAA